MQANLGGEGLILEVFRKKILPHLTYRESHYGENLDAKLGVASGTLPIPGVLNGKVSWRNETSSYNSVFECLLNQLATLRAKVVFDGINGTYDPDTVCVRLIEEAAGSPMKTGSGAYHYVILTMGHLHWLELVFRLQSSLIELGAGSRGSFPDAPSSNLVGGADVWRANKGTPKRAKAMIASVLAEDLLWQLLPQPFIPPTEFGLLVSQFFLEDGRAVPYPEEVRDAGPARRLLPQPNDYSQALTKLVAMYTVFHELEHVVVESGKQRELAVELKCDKAATIMILECAKMFRDAWGLKISNHGIEGIAACYAFPVSEQIRLIVALYHAAGDKVEKVLASLDEIGKRIEAQKSLIRQMHPGSPTAEATAELVAHEFRILPNLVLNMFTAVEPTKRATFDKARALL